ncbi:MAG: MFS transporter [Geodermatophilaceae bacterium]
MFGLYAGAVADRLDRRLIVITVDLARVVVLIGLCLTIATDSISIVVVLACLFLLGTAEVFADNTSATLLPMLVHRDDLAIGNARLLTGFITVNQLAGPPLGAALFATGMIWPFVGQAVLVFLGALLVSRIVLPRHGRSRQERRHLRHDISEGVRWAWTASGRAHTAADHLHVQHHVRSGVVGARALRHPAPGSGRDRLRPAHHRRERSAGCSASWRTAGSPGD